MAERRTMIEPDHPWLSSALQCRLRGLPRSSYYYRTKLKPVEDLALMRVIDEVYLAQPVFGSRQMTRWLRRQGYKINHKRVRSTCCGSHGEVSLDIENTSPPPLMDKTDKSHSSAVS